MTTISTPTELITAVPFLLNATPEDSLVFIALREGIVETIVQLELAPDSDFSGATEFFTPLRAADADQLLVLAYLPADFDCNQRADSLQILQSQCEEIAPVKDFLLIQNQRWRSFLCIDPGCCEPEGELLPDIASSQIAAEHVFQGRVMPPLATSHPNPSQSNNLLHELERAELRFSQCAPHLRSKHGVITLLRLISHFALTDHLEDDELVAASLVALGDIHVRDFAIGSHGDDHLAMHRRLWNALLERAPIGFRAPVATLLSLLNYESGEERGAHAALERALCDDPHYSLAHLLQKTFAAGWPPEAFTTMRHELHPKLRAELLG
jgi:hypothetical protein